MPETTQAPLPLITFVGAGNMAGAIIRGLVSKGYPPSRLRACAPGQNNLSLLKKELNISTSTDNIASIKDADVIVLGVKPQLMREVCEGLGHAIQGEPLIISLAAGTSCASIAQWLSGERAIVRSMSNTPAQIGIGASGLFANPGASETQRAIAEDMLSSIGIVRWVEHEHLIDSVTALAGSGPAYFFLMIEAMIDAAIDQGLEPNTARDLALQTARGAAELANSSDEAPSLLRARVTSPKGTTDAAIKSFEREGLRTIVKNAMEACRKRADELASQ